MDVLDESFVALVTREDQRSVHAGFLSREHAGSQITTKEVNTDKGAKTFSPQRTLRAQRKTPSFELVLSAFSAISAVNSTF
jgi:hypothetical protein